MDQSPTPTIIWLVEQAVREWVLAAGIGETYRGCDSAFRVFYMDPMRPNEIQPCGADEDRHELSFEPCDALPERDGAALLINVTLSRRVDGCSRVTEFQVALNEKLKAMVH